MTHGQGLSSGAGGAGHLPGVSDLLGPDLRLLFVGINPSVLSSQTGLHFAHPGNRFYPALREAGLLPPAVGSPAEASPELTARGIGITNLATRPTARADELSSEELQAGPGRLTRLVAAHRPAVVAVAGVTAYRAAFGRPRARTGRQPEDLGPAQLWVVPNPSGLNAHATVASLARDYREVAEAAGVRIEA